MLKNSLAVIGAGFGDEGKGLTTDFLVDHISDNGKETAIVRYSGGQQAAHCVYNDENSHIFSNFGSGTLKGKPTFWSEFCTVDPIGIVNELKALRDININPKLFININSPVTTPFDKYRNQSDYDNLEHGTCGVGVGATFEREENFYSLTFSDLFFPKILNEKLRLIKKYYISKGMNKYPKIDRFIECCEIITQSTFIDRYEELDGDKYNFIFEGSQGLLLDQHYGFFPNVTRSNTGTKNISKLMVDNVDYFVVTRAYQTRHGSGFMTNNEPTDFKITDNPNETNVYNDYQGHFIKSMLDVDLLEYGIKKDSILRNSDLHLMITCLDHLNDGYKFTHKGEVIKAKNKSDFINRIANILEIDNVYYSESPYSKNIIKFK